MPRQYEAELFGWFDKSKRIQKKAHRKELKGELEAATELYLDAEMPEEAARVLLLQADAEMEPRRRLMLCAQAERVAPDTERGRDARQRKVSISFDLAKSAGGTMQAEILRIAGELEACEQWQRAAEAYALVNDSEGEIRALKSGGLIEQLEKRLSASTKEARHERNRKQLLRRLDDLDTIGERRKAIQQAREWLAIEPDDQVRIRLERIRAKLARGPMITLSVGGLPTKFALGAELTIGRSDATLVVASSSISRQHLRVFRKPGASGEPEAYVEDLDTRNGTLLASARIQGALPVRDGIHLELAGQVPCRIAPLEATRPDGPVLIEVAGERHVAPLGDLQINAWALFDAHDGDDHYVVLRTDDDGNPPHMNGLRMAYRVELCRGDELSESHDGPIVLAVPRS